MEGLLEIDRICSRFAAVLKIDIYHDIEHLKNQINTGRCGVFGFGKGLKIVTNM